MFLKPNGASGMFVITFTNPKGGTGKTTAALLLAEVVHLAGGRVAILDCDPNHNIVQWAEERGEEGRAVPFNIIPRPRIEDMGEVIEAQEATCDYLMIDLEGTADEITTFATMASDLVVVPLQPTMMETRQAARAVKLVRQNARTLRREIPAFILFTRIKPAVRARDEMQMRGMIGEGGATVLSVELMDRSAFGAMFSEAMMLNELVAEAEGRAEGMSPSARERTLRPFHGAAENAKAYAGAVLDQLRERVADAA